MRRLAALGGTTDAMATDTQPPGFFLDGNQFGRLQVEASLLTCERAPALRSLSARELCGLLFYDSVGKDTFMKSLECPRA
jgi:hypothetical protein